MTTLHARISAGQKIVDPLRTLESDLDSAIATAGRMMTALAEGRKEAKVAACVGAATFAHLHSTVTALFQSREATVAMHASLADVRDDLRLPARAFGDESEKVEPPKNAADAPLRMVA